jgi:hypothetical protein
MDELEEGHPGYDFLLETDGEKQFIEVKGSKQNTYQLSRIQFHLALRCYAQQNESRFRLLLLDETGVIRDSDRVITMMSAEKLELIPQVLRIAS